MVDAAEPKVWTSSFTSGVVADPTDDDTGAGGYLYPEVGDAPLVDVADLREVTLSYDAPTKQLSLDIGLTAIDTHTRVGVMLLDRLDAAAHEWTIGGTELRVPQWDGHGVQLVLADPQGALYDFGVVHDLHPFTATRRPDNVIYAREGDGGAWLAGDGSLSTEVASALRLPVTIDRSGAIAHMRTTIDATRMASRMDMTQSKLYVVVFTYLLVDPGIDNLSAVEFGALEITPALGGFADSVIDGWRDADVYDLAFVSGTADQAALLSAPMIPGATDDEKSVVLGEVGAGVLAITVPN